MLVDIFNSKISVMIELSDYCNSGCPLCNRHEYGTSIPKIWVDKKSITINEFEEWFDPSFLKRVKGFIISGTYGDPVACKDLPNILEYIHKHTDVNMHINLDTNGGLRNTKWWGRIGKVFSKFNNQSYVTFWLDGLEDTLHIYRRGVDYYKVIDNAKAYIGMGGRAFWGYLQFAHNEHQEDEIARRAKEYGFETIKCKAVSGIMESGYTEIDEDKVKTIKQQKENSAPWETSISLENRM
jgi:MoaA/NifB/PqqE/SkfB family radical SAM enzyme